MIYDCPCRSSGSVTLKADPQSYRAPASQYPGTMAAVSKVTYAEQGCLPHLPVPDLGDTIARFLRSAEPVVSPAELEQLRAQAAHFLSSKGLGRKLQARLVKRAVEKVGGPAGCQVAAVAYVRGDPRTAKANRG